MQFMNSDFMAQVLRHARVIWTGDGDAAVNGLISVEQYAPLIRATAPKKMPQFEGTDGLLKALEAFLVDDSSENQQACALLYKICIVHSTSPGILLTSEQQQAEHKSFNEMQKKAMRQLNLLAIQLTTYIKEMTPVIINTEGLDINNHFHDNVKWLYKWAMRCCHLGGGTFAVSLPLSVLAGAWMSFMHLAPAGITQTIISATHMSVATLGNAMPIPVIAAFAVLAVLGLAVCIAAHSSHCVKILPALSPCASEKGVKLYFDPPSESKIADDVEERKFKVQRDVVLQRKAAFDGFEKFKKSCTGSALLSLRDFLRGSSGLKEGVKTQQPS